MRHPTLPLAVVGSGAIADSYYFPILSRDLEQRDATWIVEPVLERGRGAAEKFGFRADQVMGSVEALPLEIMAAVNATPSHLHVATTMPLIERGVGVLIEKPFAETAAAARSMIDAAAGRSVLTANHFRRLAPSYLAVKQAIEAGKIGQVKSISWAEGQKFDWPTKSGFNFRRSWPTKRPRGALLDIGVHVLDIICWWLGDKPTVRTCVMDGYGGPEAFVDTRLATATADISVRISFHSKLANQFVVQGSEGSIRGATTDFKRIEIKGANGWKPVSLGGSGDWVDYGRVLMNNFLAAISDEEDLLISPDGVLTPLELIDEAYAIATDPLPACYREWVA